MFVRGLLVLLLAGLHLHLATVRAAPDFTAIAQIVHEQHIAHPPAGLVPQDSIASLQTFLRELDPYSEYLDQAAFARAQHPTDFSRIGLGALIAVTAQGPLLVPFRDGPLFRAGVQEPALLLNLAERSVTNADAVTIGELLAERNTVNLTLSDAITEEISDITVHLASFQIPPVELITRAQYTLIRVHVFDEGRTQAALQRALQQFDQPERPAIIDLRYATGGSLLEALDSVSLILPRRQPIAITVDSAGRIVNYRGRDDRRITKGIVYLLVGPNTASAAEIFSRALQYYGYAILAGQTTFGKCLSQQLIELADGDGLKLTVGRVLDPQKRFCNNQGIEPDIAVAGNIHNTEMILRRIDAYASTRKIICHKELFDGRYALEQAAAELKWNDQRKPMLHFQAASRHRLCLGPALSEADANASLQAESERSGIALELLSLPAVAFASQPDIDIKPRFTSQPSRPPLEPVPLPPPSPLRPARPEPIVSEPRTEPKPVAAPAVNATPITEDRANEALLPTESFIVYLGSYHVTERDAVKAAFLSRYIGELNKNGLEMVFQNVDSVNSTYVIAIGDFSTRAQANHFCATLDGKFANHNCEVRSELK